jgi:hypothetical protein
MSNTTTKPADPQKPIEAPRAAPPEVVPLDRALQSIRADSKQQPEIYLEETEVPDGGE